MFLFFVIVIVNVIVVVIIVIVVVNVVVNVVYRDFPLLSVVAQHVFYLPIVYACAGHWYSAISIHNLLFIL